MAFISNDLYSTSAGTELFNYWNPFVTKFDSQSFYNFEQDNQPLYDLEERTLQLWEKSTGYSPSSLNGMPLVVSGVLDPTNRNVFTNLQEAVDALPNVIRTPTLIEVAASGYLGGLHLKNIEIIEDGVLEIVNRGFAKVYSGAGNPDAIIAGVCSSVGKTTTNANFKNNGLFNIVSSLDLSSSIQNVSALSVLTNVSSLFYHDFNRTLVQVINFAGNGERNGKISAGYIDENSGRVLGTLFPQGGGTASTENTFYLPVWEASAYNNTGYNIVDFTCSSEDLSAVRQDYMPFTHAAGTGTTGQYLIRNGAWGSSYDTAAGSRQVAGMSYANSLSAIDIQNCNGPLYIRGFCVESVKGADLQALASPPYKGDVGIKVSNSNAVIENCTAMRATTTGAKFVNSDVQLKRGFFAYRNYELISPGSSRGPNTTAGIHAVNSRVNLAIDPVYASGVDFVFNTQHHDYGAILENSVLTGGQSRPLTSLNDTALGFSYNKVGIKAINSTINVSGNLDVYNNNTGMELINSHVSTDRMTVENNSQNGIDAENSVIKYNNSQVRRGYDPDVSGYRMTQTLFHRNGTHLNLKNNSTFTYYLEPSTINIPLYYGGLRFEDSHGTANYTADITASAALPAVFLNNSQADLLHCRLVCSSTPVAAPGVIGAGIKAVNSSEVKLLGTVNGATIIQGENGTPRGVVGIVAQDNSKISFRGPTLVAQFGLGVLAENGSTVEFVPHRKEDNSVDVSGFNLEKDPGNHTSVEIHTTGDTCIGALNNSRIIMEDLGAPETSYYKVGFEGTDQGLKDTSATWIPSDYDNADTSAFVKAGSMQFYPNPAYNGYVGDRSNLANNGLLDDATLSNDVMSNGTYPNSQEYNYYLTDYYDLATATTTEQAIMQTLSVGGFCVRIVGNSTCRVNSVNFPCGWKNTNGSFFDPSATAGGCHQLRMWNVADSSKLSVAHTSVSAMQPLYASGYHGPRAVFFSGQNEEAGNEEDFNDSSATMYGAYSGTPDTSTISLLDWYGLGADTSYGVVSPECSALNEALTGKGERVGRLQQENLGPFRLFFAANEAMRYVGYISGTAIDSPANFGLGDTKPMQHISQGYSLSSFAGIPYGSIGSKVASSLHINLLTSQDYTNNMMGVVPTFNPSGYYYGSAMLNEDNGTHVYLDENSACIFANAKNCAMPPMAGRASPKVTIYRSTTEAGPGVGFTGYDAVAFGVPMGAGFQSIGIMDPRRRI